MKLWLIVMYTHSFIMKDKFGSAVIAFGKLHCSVILLSCLIMVLIRNHVLFVYYAGILSLVSLEHSSIRCALTIIRFDVMDRLWWHRVEIPSEFFYPYY